MLQPTVLRTLTFSILATTIGMSSLSTIGRANSTGVSPRPAGVHQGIHQSGPRRLAQATVAPPVAQKAVSSAVLDANRRFSFALLQAQRQTASKASGNLFISPTSVSQALSMVYQGASGTTATAMQQALQSNDISAESLIGGNAAIKGLLENPEDPQIQLTVANSLWINEGSQIKSDFIEANRRNYKARLSILKFADPRSLDRINNWVKRSTQDKIPQILSELDPQAELVLANAVYFKGGWTQAFDKSRTKDAPFQLNPTQRKTLPMMNQGGDFAYAETPEFQALRLPYGQSKRFGMYVFLPKGDLSTWMDQLNDGNWQAWQTKFINRPGTLSLPRFKISYESQLNEGLKRLGMKEAFDKDKANFSGISKNGLSISTVQHKTVLEVNETGTEAAAATGIQMVTTSAPLDPPKPFTMVVDRPFFCAIVDRQTGLPIFLGQITDPSL
jgi:serine protease inhibitor